MALELHKNRGIVAEANEQIGLECPYCGVYAHMTPQAVPDVMQIIATKPRHIGVVFQCDSCSAPVFLRFAVREYHETHAELFQNFVELERPKEKFAFSYLPGDTEVLFREALSCYTHNNFNAFASMCRRAARSAFRVLGDGGKLRAFEEVMVAREIAGIDDAAFAPIKDVLFESGDEETLPMLNRAQAGVLLEILKDMFYQCFVRHGKLTRALKVRQFFVEEGAA